MENQVKKIVAILILIWGISGCGLLADKEEMEPTHLELVKDPEEKDPGNG
ncbi:hypothetical protein [Cyclobacterium plantarum]|uniref:Lipoprotein n=1 Tax=Cyclobacterium plantarum TaxID=2716263 RepID=A0ABX0H683_9BACT|nr:hypothetical protein [Cyclobacterium plantarum]NHE55756.1 hypothetical protein [Cyclobacterium plantarum]